MSLYFGKEQDILPGLDFGWKDYKYDSPGGPGVKASARHVGRISFDLKVILSVYVLGKYKKNPKQNQKQTNKQNNRASWLYIFSPLLILAWEQA